MILLDGMLYDMLLDTLEDMLDDIMRSTDKEFNSTTLTFRDKIQI